MKMRLLRLPRALLKHEPPASGGRLRDRFELLVTLGSGGFGTVWEGFDMLLERPVAIKEIEIETRRAGAAELAMREARATARLNHPGIVSLYEVVQEDERLYLVSELVDGRTLADLFDEGLLSDRDVAVIGVALCEALAHAHDAGVVHRDVKPANVMVPRAWCEQVSGWRAQPAKLMDFGIATVLGATGAGDELVAGSYQYMAPEQAAGGAVSPAADVYSLAAVLYEGFTGAPPTGRRRRDRLSVQRPDLPPDLTNAIDAALVDDPVYRSQLDELADLLNAARPRLSDALDRPGWMNGMFGRWRIASTGGFGSEPVNARIVWGATLALFAVLLNTVVGAPLGMMALVAGALLGAASPRYGPALLIAGAAGMLAGTGMQGAAVLLASALVPAALATVKSLERPARGAFAAWFLLVCGVLGDQALLLALPTGLPANDAIVQQPEAALEALTALLSLPALATIALWAAAATAWPWVTGGPRRLGLLARSCLWASALAGGQLAVALLLGTELAPPAFALSLAVVAISGGLGLAQWRSGRVFDMPGAAAAS